TVSSSTWTPTKLPDELSLHSHQSNRVPSQLSTTQPNSTSSGAEPETNKKRARLIPLASGRQRAPGEARPAPFVPGRTACLNIREDIPPRSSRPGRGSGAQQRGGPSRVARRRLTRHWLPSNPREWRDTTDRLRLAPANSCPPFWGGRSPPS